MTNDPFLRLLTYSQAGGAPRAGLLLGEHVHALAAHSVLALLADDPALAGLPQEAARLRASGAPGLPLQEITLHAPVMPGTVYAAGANYRDHLAEMARANGREPGPDPRERGVEPWFFTMPPRACVVGDGATVHRPALCRKLDWEAELAVVIGLQARNVTPGAALRHAAGYTLANDLSARDLARRANVEPGSFFHFDWLAHKSFDGSCPLGPWITPACDVPDPQALAVRLWVNGVLKQDSSTREMIYSVAEQIACLSRSITLYPGDVLLTGTPAGVGAPRAEFLQPADEVRITIGDLGSLHTTIA